MTRDRGWFLLSAMSPVFAPLSSIESRGPLSIFHQNRRRDDGTEERKKGKLWKLRSQGRASLNKWTEVVTFKRRRTCDLIPTSKWCRHKGNSSDDDCTNNNNVQSQETVSPTSKSIETLTEKCAFFNLERTSLLLSDCPYGHCSTW